MNVFLFYTRERISFAGSMCYACNALTRYIVRLANDFEREYKLERSF